MSKEGTVAMCPPKIVSHEISQTNPLNAALNPLQMKPEELTYPTNRFTHLILQSK